MSAPPPIAKKPRLIIINKDKAELRLSDCIVRHSPNSMAPSLGAPPRSSAPSLGAPPLACTRFNNKTWQEYQDWLNANQQTYEHIYKRPLKCIYGAPREISHKKIPPQAKILVIEMNNDENKIMGIGEIINQTASEVYRRPQAVVPLANAHSTSPLAVVPPPPPLPPTNRAELPSRGGGTPTNRAELPSRGGGTPSGPPVLKYKIFSDRNYSRYIYIGNTRYATREELERNHTPDAQYINEQLANANTKMPQTSQQLQHHPTPLSMIETTERLLFKGPRHMKRGSGITKIQIHSEVSKTNRNP